MPVQRKNSISDIVKTTTEAPIVQGVYGTAISIAARSSRTIEQWYRRIIDLPKWPCCRTRRGKIRDRARSSCRSGFTSGGCLTPRLWLPCALCELTQCNTRSLLQSLFRLTSILGSQHARDSRCRLLASSLLLQSCRWQQHKGRWPLGTACALGTSLLL